MTHRFPIKELALQAGMSTATVDRVLNNRAHVSPQTRRRVEAAMNELAGQEAQMAARGRRLFIDFVVEAPARFSQKIRRACEVTLPDFHTAVVRPRFTFQEVMSDRQTLNHLERIIKRGSHGVCLKARDVPAVRSMVTRLRERRIPVVTFVTDIPSSGCIGYAGIDNLQAGRTAAYLVAKNVPHGTGTILTSRSNRMFQGEDERMKGFAEALSQRRPDLDILDVPGGAGLNIDTASRIAAALQDSGNIVGVYSMGGGNAAILDMLADQDKRPEVFVAHDLDSDNLRLLRAEKLTYVLQHDLVADVSNVFRLFAAHHRLIPALAKVTKSDVRIVTAENIPDEQMR